MNAQQATYQEQLKTFYEILDDPKCSDCGEHTKYVGSKFGKVYRYFYFRSPSCNRVDVVKGQK